MKSTVYLDTTIPSYIFDERDSIKMHIEITKKWWIEESANFDIWASEETFNEISEGKYPRQQAYSSYKYSLKFTNSRNCHTIRIILRDNR
jgi:hypothetical protein